MTTAPRNAERTRLPTWLVSSRNGVVLLRDGDGASWRPFGVHHARSVGSPLTACGEGALGWELFWDMPFPAEESGSCVACLDAIQRLRHS
jgi:hypothetical protein